MRNANNGGGELPIPLLAFAYYSTKFNGDSRD